MPAKGKVRTPSQALHIFPTTSVYRNKVMKVFVNNQTIETEDGTALFSILQQQGIAAQKGIAVAVNNAVVPRSAWEKSVLHPNDKITIIRATQGG